MQRWSRRGEKSHQRPKKSEKGAVQQHPCPAPESRCRGRAVFWAYGPRHIEWPLPKVICPIFWAIGRAGVNGGVKTSQVAAQKSATVDMACLSAV